MDTQSLQEGEGEEEDMTMTCPKCGEEVSWEDTDVIIWSMARNRSQYGIRIQNVMVSGSTRGNEDAGSE